MATLLSRGESSSQRMYAFKTLAVPLLGFATIQALGIVKPLGGVEILAPQGLFEGLRTLMEQYTVRLRSDAELFSLSVQRRMLISVRWVVGTELSILEHDGVIR